MIFRGEVIADAIGFPAWICYGFARMGLIEVVANQGDLCGESPLWKASEQAIYWTDIAGQRVYRCTLPERKIELMQVGFEVCGLALHESGGFVIVNSGGVWRWDLKDGMHPVLNTIDNKKCALNDCVVDPEGRIFTGSCFFDPNRDDYPSGYLFRIDHDGAGG
jgi:sugar lactone lactonase YvrE